MKPFKYSLVCFILSSLLAVGFAVRLWADAVYSYPYGSAPFWLYAAERFAEFLIPAILLLAAGILLKKRSR